jgi:uncharacterized membrane protein
MRDMLTLHSITYRLILGAAVLVIVIPVWSRGHQPMWLVSLITILVVTAVGILLARQPRLRAWLQRR